MRNTQSVGELEKAQVHFQNKNNLWIVLIINMF